MARTFRAKVFALKSDSVWLEMDLGFRVWKTQEVFGLEHLKDRLKPGQELVVSVSMDKTFYPTQHAYIYRYYAEVIEWVTEESTKKRSLRQGLQRMRQSLAIKKASSVLGQRIGKSSGPTL